MNVSIPVPHIKQADRLSPEVKRAFTYLGIAAGAWLAFKLTQHIIRSIRVSSLENQFDVKK